MGLVMGLEWEYGGQSWTVLIEYDPKKMLGHKNHGAKDHFDTLW